MPHASKPTNRTHARRCQGYGHQVHQAGDHGEPQQRHQGPGDLLAQDEQGLGRAPYHRVSKGDYWVQDNGSRFYNDRRNKSQGGFGTRGSEYLPSYQKQHAWSLVIDFNRPNAVKKRGSGIFLHVNGKSATAGCVSAPKWFIEHITQLMRKKYAPRIAIGR